MTISKNKSLETIAAIEELIQQQASDWCMDDQEDRANMAWWIYRNFIKGDFIESKKVYSPSNPNPKAVTFKGPLPGKE